MGHKRHPKLLDQLRARIRARHEITVRDGKGMNDRITMLPQSLVRPLELQLDFAKTLHATDLEEGFGSV